jgi:amino acid transporter
MIRRQIVLFRLRKNGSNHAVTPVRLQQQLYLEPASRKGDNIVVVVVIIIIIILITRIIITIIIIIKIIKIIIMIIVVVIVVVVVVVVIVAVVVIEQYQVFLNANNSSRSCVSTDQLTNELFFRFD